MNEKRIYKYELEIEDGQNISLPIGAEILDAQMQSDKLCMWCLVNPKVPTEIRNFEIFGTGHPVLSDMGTSRKYIATVQTRGLVFHLFEYTGV